jgi:hypothetical protein
VPTQRNGGRRRRKCHGCGRKRLGQPIRVSRMKAAIVTYPEPGDQGFILKSDLELVRAALLYVDEIELVSLSAALHHVSRPHHSVPVALFAAGGAE